MPALIIKQRFILVPTDELCWYITYNQLGQMLFQYLNRILSRPNVTQGQIVYFTPDYSN